MFRALCAHHQEVKIVLYSILVSSQIGHIFCNNNTQSHAASAA